MNNKNNLYVVKRFEEYEGHYNNIGEALIKAKELFECGYDYIEKSTYIDKVSDIENFEKYLDLVNKKDEGQYDTYYASETIYDYGDYKKDGDISQKSFESFNADLVEIQRHRISVTQGSYLIKYDGNNIIKYNDKIKILDSSELTSNDPKMNDYREIIRGWAGVSNRDIIETARRLYTVGDRINGVEPLYLSANRIATQDNILTQKEFKVNEIDFKNSELFNNDISKNDIKNILKHDTLFMTSVSRDTSKMRGTQDKFKMLITDIKNNVIMDLGSHPSQVGAEAYLNKNIKLIPKTDEQIVASLNEFNKKEENSKKVTTTLTQK